MRSSVTGPQSKGLAFDIDDLQQAHDWAVVHDRRMCVCLDHGADGEEYEEVIELHAGVQSRAKVILWRNAQAVFVQPLPGRRQRYRSMQEALAGLLAGPTRIAVAAVVARSSV